MNEILKKDMEKKFLNKIAGLKKMISPAITITFLLVILSLSEIYAQGQDPMQEIQTKFDGFFKNIKKILAVILSIVFFVGIIHVVSAKSDRDPERFKKLIINYVIAIVFVLIAVGVISIVQSSFENA